MLTPRIPEILISVAFVGLLSACSDAPTPTDSSPLRPNFNSVHYTDHNMSVSGPNDDGTLDVSFKLAGLGSNVTLTVTASADGAATYACRNNGGNFPADPKKEVVAGPVSASDDFTSGKNGQIVGSLRIFPPASTLDCPNGQHEVFISVSYSNVQVTESSGQAGAFIFEGTFQRTFLLLIF